VSKVTEKKVKLNTDFIKQQHKYLYTKWWLD